MKRKTTKGLVFFSVLLVISLSVALAEKANNQTVQNTTMEKNANINASMNETINQTMNETINQTTYSTEDMSKYFNNTKGDPPSEDDV